MNTPNHQTAKSTKSPPFGHFCLKLNYFLVISANVSPKYYWGNLQSTRSHHNNFICTPHHINAVLSFPSTSWPTVSFACCSFLYLKSVENWGFGLAQVIYCYGYVHAIILVLDKREKLKKKLNKRRIFTVQNKKSGIEFN